MINAKIDKFNKYMILLIMLLLTGCSNDNSHKDAIGDYCGKWYQGPCCIKTSKVIEIKSIISRGGYVLLDNGMTVDVGQPYENILIGSKICTEFEKD